MGEVTNKITESCMGYKISVATRYNYDTNIVLIVKWQKSLEL